MSPPEIRVTVSRGDLEYEVAVALSLHVDTAAEVVRAWVNGICISDPSALPADVADEAVAIAEEPRPESQPEPDDYSPEEEYERRERELDRWKE